MEKLSRFFYSFYLSFQLKMFLNMEFTNQQFQQSCISFMFCEPFAKFFT